MALALKNRTAVRPWSPGKWTPRMAGQSAHDAAVIPENGNGSKALGLSLLSATTVFSAFAAFNPSTFTLLSFASKPEARARAMPGIWMGLGASLLGSAAIGLAFDSWAPAIAGGLTGVVLFGVSMWAINHAPLTTVPAIEQQGP
jgi:hypothetical protein